MDSSTRGLHQRSSRGGSGRGSRGGGFPRGGRSGGVSARGGATAGGFNSRSHARGGNDDGSFTRGRGRGGRGRGGFHRCQSDGRNQRDGSSHGNRDRPGGDGQNSGTGRGGLKTLRERPSRRFDQRELRKWSCMTESPVQLVASVMSFLPELKEFLGKRLESTEVELLLKVLDILLKIKDSHKSNLTSLLRLLIDAHFFSDNLHLYLSQRGQSGVSMFNQDVVYKTVAVIKLFLPEKLWSMERLLLLLPNNADSKTDHVVNLLKDCKISHLNQKGNHKAKHTQDAHEPPNDIRDISIFPTKRDLEAGFKPYLRKNKTKGSFDDVHHYFDIVFRLVREDFISPLREGLARYKERGGGKDENSNMRFYENVTIAGIEVDKGIQHVLMLDMSKTKGIRYDMEKSLVFGSLVCLSHDNFETIIYAVVSQLERNDVRKGIVRVKFANHLNGVYTVPTDQPLKMTENPAYFEAYCHVLEGLQDMSTRPLPMSEYLVKCNTAVSSPKYLSYGVKYDIQTILESAGPPRRTECDVLKTTSWPTLGRTRMNNRQYDALKNALTKKLSLLQGPPGTGKTYVGLRVMEVLLNNIEKRCAPGTRASGVKDPVLIICYTNHALDQFLEEMLHFCPEGIVRVGSRSTSEALEKCNLNKVKDRVGSSHDVRLALYDCYREMDTLSIEIQTFAYKMQLVHFEIQQESVLQKFMEPNHVDSLTRGNRRSSPAVMKSWLNTTSKDIETHLMQEVDEKLVCFVNTTTDVVSDDRVVFENPKDKWLHGKMVKQFDPFNINNMPNNIKASLYRFWLQQFRKATHLPEPPSQILQDEFIQPFIRQRVMGHIMKNHPNQGGFSIKAWLFGTTLTQKLDSLADIQNNSRRLQIKTAPQQGKDAKMLEDKDEYKRMTNQRVFEDDSDEDFPNGDNEDKITVTNVIKRAFMLGLNVTGKRPNQPNEDDEWITVKKPLSFGGVVRKLKSTKPMSELQAMAVRDIWQLPVPQRFQLYKYWLSKYLDNLNDSLQVLVIEYEELIGRKKELTEAQTVSLLKDAKVIGMTTTGAAKHRRVLQQVAPRVVLVEEAAEVLEAHITTALSTNCEHLILIGDHQQLRPKTAVHKLAQEFKLDLSMFERLVNNGIECVQLTEQRRMRPEISMFMKHIYPHLTDADSVDCRDNVRGMKKNVFFITHNQPEQVQKQSKSRLNPYEADYLTRLCEYLVLQGYEQKEITILGAYGAQVALIKKNTRDIGYPDVVVSTVDNYQGEQNKIVLLSLVRSNDVGNVGFLGTDNRVCVALSRAQYGMYVIADVDLLSGKSKLWMNIKATATEYGLIGSTLELRCNHHGRLTEIANPSDFDTTVNGGCGKPCGDSRECGHHCPQLCHGRPHSDIPCKSRCSRKCDEGHQCRAKCFQDCPPCSVPVERETPCGHLNTMQCHDDENKVQCQTQCDQICVRNHLCAGKCSQICPPCVEPVEKSLSCGHKKFVDCHRLDDYAPCDEPCPKQCGKGHNCGGNCSQVCPPCLVKIDTVLSCGHDATIACSMNPSQVVCAEPCKKVCVKGHGCKGKCFQKCPPCEEKVAVDLKCGHKATSCCFEDPEHVACEVPCSKRCPEGHPCVGKCSKSCPLCTQVVEKTKACGHTVKVTCYRSKYTSVLDTCEEPCLKRCNNGHRCKDRCSRKCPPCQTVVEYRRKCGHETVKKCSDDKENAEAVRCMVTTGKTTMKCSHGRKVKCFESQPSIMAKLKITCNAPCEKKCSRDHTCSGVCGDKCPPCSKSVKVRMSKCSHVLAVPCHRYTSSRSSIIKCTERCSKKCANGHACKSTCGVPCPPCEALVASGCCQVCKRRDFRLVKCYKKSTKCEDCVAKQLKDLSLIDLDFD